MECNMKKVLKKFSKITFALFGSLGFSLFCFGTEESNATIIPKLKSQGTPSTPSRNNLSLRISSNGELGVVPSGGNVETTGLQSSGLKLWITNNGGIDLGSRNSDGGDTKTPNIQTSSLKLWVTNNGGVDLGSRNSDRGDVKPPNIQTSNLKLWITSGGGIDLGSR